MQTFSYRRFVMTTLLLLAWTPTLWAAGLERSTTLSAPGAASATPPQIIQGQQRAKQSEKVKVYSPPIQQVSGTINMLSPVGNPLWLPGSTHTIKWSHAVMALG